jgi:CPA1 family monovalent cation:H+ antiporter
MIESLAFYIALLLVALIIQPITDRLRIPFSAALVLLGFGASEVFVFVGGDTGLRWELFHDLVFFVFLPVLIFEGAFNADLRDLLRNLPIILFLALPLMLLSSAATAAILFYGIGHPQGFPWLAALIAGALLSATDPVAVLALFKRVGSPERLRTIIDGESLFNDATAVVLFTLLVALATGERESASFGEGTEAFLLIFLGGALIGALAGGAAMILHLILKQPVARGVLSLTAGYAAFLSAESLHVSGVIAALLSGLILGYAERRAGEKGGLRELQVLWEYKAWIANALLFLISGVSFQLVMFTDQWLAILIGIGAVLAARAVSVFAFIPLLDRIPGINPLPTSWRPVIWWGGVRGAVTLALALSLPVTLDYWWTIQSIAYGVVLWTLLVQAGTMPWLMRGAGIQTGADDCRSESFPEK